MIVSGGDKEGKGRGYKVPEKFLGYKLYSLS